MKAPQTPIKKFPTFYETERSKKFGDEINACKTARLLVAELPGLEERKRVLQEQIEACEIEQIFSPQPELPGKKLELARLAESIEKITRDAQFADARAARIENLRTNAAADYRKSVAPAVMEQVRSILDNEYLPALEVVATLAARLNVAAAECRKHDLPACCLFPGLSFSRGPNDVTLLSTYARNLRQHFGVAFNETRPELAASIAGEAGRALLSDEQGVGATFFSAAVHKPRLAIFREFVSHVQDFARNNGLAAPR